MKKLVIAIATAIAAVALVSTATATDTAYETEGFLCGIQAPDGGAIFTEDTSFVIYASGKAVLKCHAQLEGASGDRTVLSPKNTDTGCRYQDSEVGFIDLPFWKSIHSANGQVVLTCNGQVDLNGSPDSPEPRRSAGGAAGN